MSTKQDLASRLRDARTLSGLSQAQVASKLKFHRPTISEIEAGRRQILGGELGSTTASFAGGQAFTLIPDQRTDGWVGRFRASGGSPGFRIGGEVGAEEQQSRAALSLRATLQIGL